MAKRGAAQPQSLGVGLGGGLHHTGCVAEYSTAPEDTPHTHETHATPLCTRNLPVSGQGATEHHAQAESADYDFSRVPPHLPKKDI
ncbi:hypothetical protein GCM10010455_30030 [Microbacterium esteraromaticum]